MNVEWLAVFESLRKVYTEEAYSNMAINEALLHHKGCQESFVRNFVKGVLRQSIQIDYYIDVLAAKGIKSISARSLIILRMGIHAIDNLGSVPEYAAVSEAVELAKRVARGSDKLINGILRSYIREKDSIEIPADRLDIKYSMHDSIVSILKEQYGDESDEIIKTLNEPASMVIRINRLKADKARIIKELESQGIKISETEESELAYLTEGSGIAGSKMYRDGLISIQSFSSIIAVDALSPLPGSKVLDLCAAPGGKTAYMAELMDNQGEIMACDIHDHRIELIEKNIKRLGIDIVRTINQDAAKHVENMDNNYDYVLCDVPCSGIGVIASKPEIRFKDIASEQTGLIELQKSIICNAALYTAPGGRLEYSTCTLNKNENEKIIDYIMDSEIGSSLSVLEMKTLMPYNCKVGFFYCIMEKKTPSKI